MGPTWWRFPMMGSGRGPGGGLDLDFDLDLYEERRNGMLIMQESSSSMTETAICSCEE